MLMLMSGEGINATAGLGFIGGIFIIIAFIIASMWKVYEKAGQPGWAALIPIYNMFVLLEIVKKPKYWFYLMFIPYAGFIWMIWTYNLLSKRFGYGVGFTLGLIFLPFIFFPILGFGESRYIDDFAQNTADQILYHQQHGGQF